jgi:hypothetical protein
MKKIIIIILGLACMWGLNYLMGYNNNFSVIPLAVVSIIFVALVVRKK